MSLLALLSNHIKLLNPRRSEEDEHTLIEKGRLTKSKVGDLFASATSDTSKRKLVKQDGQPQYQPVNKKPKSTVPSGLLPDASVSHMNLTTPFTRTTKTPTMKNSMLAEDPDFSSRYGGIMDSDFAESSPPPVMEKAGITKITCGAPTIKLEGMETVQTAVRGCPWAIRRKEVYNQNHLPAGTIISWKTYLIPSWRDLAGTQINAWHTTLPKLCDELKEIWDIVYPSQTQEIIELDGPIFSMWHGNIGHAILLFVNKYMKEYLDDVDVRATHATFMKGDTIQIPFAWKEHPLSAEELQAECTFTFWVTGISTADDEKCKEEAKFSEDNWGMKFSMITSLSFVT
ncbi:hypothetical protein BYT27DRAFT_7255244 [Phlegmacium glaucopus]|nr:hypothetical protein BYT27DRAFT_7255244 [Phlegmacium glaucopus]